MDEATDDVNYASIDETHDDICLYDGYCGMMMDLYDEDYKSYLIEDWKDELDEHHLKSKSRRSLITCPIYQNVIYVLSHMMKQLE